MAQRKGFADLFGEELFGAVVEYTRLQTLEMMNYLSEVGPAWSGEFRDSWRAKPVADVPMAAGRQNPSYPYELRDIPRPGYDAKTYKRQTKLFSIVNESTHAPYALDAREGTFYPPDDQPEPIEDIVVEGKRARKGFRAAITPNDELLLEERPGKATATAEDGWFQDAAADLPALMKDRKAELMSKARRTAKEKVRRRRAR
jgi:hypothetical protein